MHRVSLTVFLCLALSAGAHAGVITAWNFNDAVSGETGGLLEFTPEYGHGFMTSNFQANNIKNTTGSTLNAWMGEPAGRALLLVGKANNGKSLTWKVDTTGYASIDVRFATRRTSTGFRSNQFLYSIDSGFSWTPFGLAYEPGTDFVLQSFDLGNIDLLNDNPGAEFRIVFDGATTYSGNNRIDNLVISGIPLSPPTTTPVPETSTAVLTGLGLSGVILLRRRLTGKQVHLISRCEPCVRPLKKYM